MENVKRFGKYFDTGCLAQTGSADRCETPNASGSGPWGDI